MPTLLGLPAACLACPALPLALRVGGRPDRGLSVCAPPPRYLIFSRGITRKRKKRDCRIGWTSRETVGCGYDMYSSFSLSAVTPVRGMSWFLKAHVQRHGQPMSILSAQHPQPAGFPPWSPSLHASFPTMALGQIWPAIENKV